MVRSPSFLYTSTTTLHHGFWLGWIAPTPSCVHGLHPPLEREFFGTSSWRVCHQKPRCHVLLIPYSPTLKAPGKRCDTELTGLRQPPDFCLTTYLGQIIQLLEEQFLLQLNCHPSLLDTIYLTQSLLSPGGYFHWWYCIHSYNLSNFNALGNSDWDGHQVFHYHCNFLASRNHFGVYVHYTHVMRKVGSITPFQGLSHYMHVVSQEQGFHLAMYYFEQKSIHIFLPCHFDHPIQVSWIHCLTCDSFPLNQKSCSLTSQQLGYPQSIQGSQQFIDITFLDHIDDPIDNGCTQSNW